MSSLSFPDVNVWLALLRADHVHRAAALAWWNEDDTDEIAFIRLTQMAVLRLLTTPAAMNGRALTMAEAWSAYDRLFLDDRVTFVDEPPGVERRFRRVTDLAQPSSKLWADAWLLSVAQVLDGAVVTLDKALADRSDRGVLLSETRIL